jgi:hypothetical protein
MRGRVLSAGDKTIEASLLACSLADPSTAVLTSDSDMDVNVRNSRYKGNNYQRLAIEDAASPRIFGKARSKNNILVDTRI